MDLLGFLSIVTVSFVFIICFIIGNFKDITKYYEYKESYYDHQRLKDNYKKEVIKYINSIEDFNKRLNNLKVADDIYVRNHNNLVSFVFDLKKILDSITTDAEMLDVIKKKITDLEYESATIR